MVREELLGADIRKLEETRGTIANIERYAINDGSGVRTTVFFKGCYLRCRWCSNPETQAFYPEMSFFSDKCIACMNCLRSCPYGAIREDLSADRSICSECYKKEEAFTCTKKCYPQCRKMTGESLTVKEVYDVVKRDASFYEASGGGVTISGGEPFAQPEYLYALLRTLTERWINTAVETCGFANPEDYRAIVPYLNTVFMDIKHMDPKKHEEWTGQSNERILGNIRLVDELAGTYGYQLFLRIPVIPGFNDSVSDIEAAAVFVSENLKHVTGMELLPYHRLGRGKYHSLEKPYELEDIVSPTDGYMQELNAVLARHDIPIYQF